MTPSDWASQRVAGKVCDACGPLTDGDTDQTPVIHVGVAARLLRLEHARAVRIINRLKQRAYLYFVEETFDADQFDAYIAALDDVKAALQRGRTQKGTR